MGRWRRSGSMARPPMVLRTGVVLRTAEVADAPALTELWAEHLRPGSHAAQVDDMRTAIAASALDEDARMVVAEVDGEVLGVLHVRAAAASPVNLEQVAQVYGPLVQDDGQRRGVGSALMDAAVTFAEERGIPHMVSAALSASRDSNRFFARLSMGPRAVLRVASTHAVRQRLGAGRSPRGAAALATTRNIDRVLAARRGRRQSRAAS